MQASVSQHTSTSADWRLSTLTGFTVHELRGGGRLAQVLAEKTGEQALIANEARPVPGGALLHTEPEAWLLLNDGSSGAEAQSQALHDAAVANGYAIAATEGYRLLRLEGAGATALLARFCALDVRPDAFPPRRCARILVAQVPLVIYRTDTAAFTLICPASYADYLELALGENGRR